MRNDPQPVNLRNSEREPSATDSAQLCQFGSDRARNCPDVTLPCVPGPAKPQISGHGGWRVRCYLIPKPAIGVQRTMRRFVSIAFLASALGVAACAPAHREAAAPKRLYFAVELYRDGRMVGKPRLLGESGKLLKAVRRQPGSDLADYSLALSPVQQGDRYRIGVRLEVPDLSASSELALLHGEMRTIELGPRPGELAIALTLLEVDSAEFRALMDLVGDHPSHGAM